jgi:NAD(P)-dependent dehydrogenase (short-subunit alcohol dehydrogenase family)
VPFAVEAHCRRSEDGIGANAVHPGAIIDTNLSRHMELAQLEQAWASALYTYKSIAQGAATTSIVATSPQPAGIGGRYFEDANQGAVLALDAIARASHGVAPYALDPTQQPSPPLGDCAGEAHFIVSAPSPPGPLRHGA